MNNLFCNDWYIESERHIEAILSTIKDKDINITQAIAESKGRYKQNTSKVEMYDDVAVIRVTGPLFKDNNIFTYLLGFSSYESISLDFHACLKDSTVKSILFCIDSPGGQAQGNNELATMIYSNRGKKPIKAYIEGYGASAAYFIASACDEIVCDESAIVGSIGTMLKVRKSKDDDFTFVSSISPNKNADIESEAGSELLQEMVDDLGQVFLSKVAKFRNKTCEEIKEAGNHGGVRVGTKAFKYGLVDKLSSFIDVINEMKGVKTMADNVVNQEEQKVVPQDLSEVSSKAYDEGVLSERARVTEILSMSEQGAETIINEAIVNGLAISEVKDKMLSFYKSRQVQSVEDSLANNSLVVPPVAESSLVSKQDEQISSLVNAINKNRK